MQQELNACILIPELRYNSMSLARFLIELPQKDPFFFSGLYPVFKKR